MEFDTCPKAEVAPNEGCPKAEPEGGICGDDDPNAEGLLLGWAKAELDVVDCGAIIPEYGLEYSTRHACIVPSFKYAYMMGDASAKSVRSTSRAASIVSCIELSSGSEIGFSCDC